MTHWAGDDRMLPSDNWGFDRSKFTEGVSPPPRFCRICGKSTRGGHMGKREPMAASLCWDCGQGGAETRHSRKGQALTDWDRIRATRQRDAKQAETDRKAGIMYRDGNMVYGENGMRRVNADMG